MKQELTRLIQFAINNGYEFFAASSVRKIESKHKVFRWREFPQYWTIKIHCLDDCDVPKEITITNENYCNTITSKPFIEAVARGINPTMKNWSMWLNIEIDWITTKQAIAIRDNKLPDFINNLLPKE